MNNFNQERNVPCQQIYLVKTGQNQINPFETHYAAKTQNKMSSHLQLNTLDFKVFG